MAKEPIRVYADTSVFGGVFDPEFARASRAFFEQVAQGLLHLVTSRLVASELRGAPQHVRDFAEWFLANTEEARISPECWALANAYLAEGIVSPGSTTDALQVAVATVAKCQAIVSWNFSHIVHFQKIPRYNAMNALRGYGAIDIYSPQAVMIHEEEDI
jgi:predicted nucleic acid-binding protein